MIKQFTHAGVGIIVLTNGQFAAHVNGIEVRRTTLAAICKEIDGNVKFVEFDALKWDRHSMRSECKLDTFRIVGTRKTKRRNRVQYVWLDSKGTTYYHVTPDTPANRKAMIAARKMEQRIYKIEEANREKLEALEKLVPEIAPPNPDDKPVQA